jgi:hypothetical protein
MKFIRKKISNIINESSIDSSVEDVVKKPVKTSSVRVENQFISNFEEGYKEQLANTGFFNPAELKELNNISASDLNPLNKKEPRRPLIIQNGKFIATVENRVPYNNNIGKDVANIEIPISKPVYLVLNYGKRKDFIALPTNNSRLFPFSVFSSLSDEYIGSDGEALLDFFAIEYPRFIKTFGKNGVPSHAAKYKRGPKKPVDVTDEVDLQEISDFVLSCIGCGYILCQIQDSGKLHYYNLRTIEDTKDFIGNEIPDSVILRYPENFDTKRVTVDVDYPNVSFRFIFRSKGSTVYPTHLTCSYFLKNQI